MPHSVSSLLLLTLGYASAAEKPEFCHALALSGGGNKGSYEAGVINGLITNSEKNDTAWRVCSGVSAGSLNCAYISGFAIGDELNMTTQHIAYTRALQNDMVYAEWPDGLEEGLLEHSGIFDTRPLHDTVRGILGKRPPQKMYVAGVSNTDTGDYVTFDEKLNLDDLAFGITGSASIPFVFPSQHLHGVTLNDGGSIYNTNLISAVEKCNSEGYTDDKIILDIVICGHHDPIKQEEKTGTTIQNYFRAWYLQGEKKSLRNIYEFMRARPKIDFRYFVYPSIDIGPLSKEHLNFSGNYTEPMIELGMKDGKSHVEAGKGKHFKLLQEFMEFQEENAMPGVHEFNEYVKERQ